MTQGTITIIAACLSPVLTIIGTILIAVWENRRGKLVYYITPAHMMDVVLGSGTQHVQTVLLFLENRTGRPLKNVVVAHHDFPVYYRVQPAIELTEIDLAGNCKGLKLPSFPARSIVTIVYLFLQQPPGNILNRIYSDEGDGLNVPMMFQKQMPSWERRTLKFFAFLGGWAALFLVIKFVLIVFTLRRLIG